MRALGVNVKGYLLGNKNDVNQDRQVITDKEAHRLAEKLNLKYYKVTFHFRPFQICFKTSAREYTGIQEAFSDICSNCFTEWSENPDALPILTEQ